MNFNELTFQVNSFQEAQRKFDTELTNDILGLLVADGLDDKILDESLEFKVAFIVKSKIVQLEYFKKKSLLEPDVTIKVKINTKLCIIYSIIRNFDTQIDETTYIQKIHKTLYNNGIEEIKYHIEYLNGVYEDLKKWRYK